MSPRLHVFSWTRQFLHHQSGTYSFSRNLATSAIRPHIWRGCRTSTHAPKTASWASQAPSWRRCVSTGQFYQQWQPGVGAEPGIDPATKQGNPEHRLHEPEVTSEIRIIDYSNKQILESEVKQENLESFLRDQPKPGWATVRWIYVNGLNFNVVRCLGNSKGLHPLAIEDVMDTHTPTKVDWYDDHCCLEMNLVKLVHGAQPEITTRSEQTSEGTNNARGRWRSLVPGRFGIEVEQVSAFLTTDNTIITIFEHSGNEIFTPIMTRLRSTQTVVRSINDPSMLLQAVIDAIVDLSLPIGKAVGEAFDDLEQAVLAKPTIGQSKQLHILRSGLTLLMENANAIGILVRTLCDHGAIPGTGRAESSAIAPAMKDQVKTSVEISPTTQIYLRDVQDHVTALANNTRTSIRSAENLSSLIFNTIAASQNESVRQLTLVSSFFLPLTFLTGYFGMNFDPMPVVNNHSDAFFWLIATPVMLSTLYILMRTRSKINRPDAWMRQTRPSNFHSARSREMRDRRQR